MVGIGERKGNRFEFTISRLRDAALRRTISKNSPLLTKKGHSFRVALMIVSGRGLFDYLTSVSPTEIVSPVSPGETD
jgi:hypothetical protein